MKQKLPRTGFFVGFFLVLCMVCIHLLQPEGCYGIIPRYGQGLRGILLAPLFHSDWEHLFNNAIPLLVLLFMVFSFYPKTASLLLVFGWLLTGTLVWFFADLWTFLPYATVGCHVGASGLVYLLASFVFFSGLFRRSLPLLAVSLVVVFLYGSLLWGIFPEELFQTKMDRHISWESHLAGAIVGFFFALVWRKIGPQRKQWAWQNREVLSKEDEELWQRYLEKYPEEQEEPMAKEKKPPFKEMF